MKKFICLSLLLLLSIFCLTGCNEESSEEKPTYEISESELYSKEEITEAMDAMTEYFYDHSEICTLQKITYDESFSLSQLDRYEDYIEGSGNDDIVVFTATYDREEYASEPNLIPAETCVNYWVMLRTNGKWSYFDDLSVYQEGIDHPPLNY